MPEHLNKLAISGSNCDYVIVFYVPPGYFEQDNNVFTMFLEEVFEVECVGIEGRIMLI